MKTLPLAIAAIAIAFSVPAALAQTSDTTMKAGTAAKADASSQRARQVRRHRHYTTGTGLHGGSHVTPLPGKDELNSKAYLVDH